MADVARTEQLVLDASVPISGNFTDDLEQLQTLLEDIVPAYILARLDGSKPEFLFVTYVPDRAGVRDKVSHAFASRKSRNLNNSMRFRCYMLLPVPPLPRASAASVTLYSPPPRLTSPLRVRCSASLPDKPSQHLLSLCRTSQTYGCCQPIECTRGRNGSAASCGTCCGRRPSSRVGSTQRNCS